MSKIHEIIVVGAGASGLMFGALVQQRVLFIDVNEQIAMKLKISGGGKCNITNTTVKTSDYLGDSEFISHALGELSSSELLSFFDGVELQERKYGQIFGANSSKDFIDVLKKRNIKNEFKLNTKVLHVQKNGEFFEVQTSDGNFLSKKLIVASGGVSFAQVGVSEIGYKIASDFGHSIKKISPALVGLTIQKEQFWFKELSGISFFANATCSGRRFGGDLLFSHKGISGPLALDISLFWEKGREIGRAHV